MSKRRFYSVSVNGVVVFSGSYRSAINVYEAFSRVSDFRPDIPVDVPFDVFVSFRPDLSDNIDDGGFLHV